MKRNTRFVYLRRFLFSYSSFHSSTLSLFSHSFHHIPSFPHPFCSFSFPPSFPYPVFLSRIFFHSSSIPCLSIHFLPPFPIFIFHSLFPLSSAPMSFSAFLLLCLMYPSTFPLPSFSLSPLFLPFLSFLPYPPFFSPPLNSLHFSPPPLLHSLTIISLPLFVTFCLIPFSFRRRGGMHMVCCRFCIGESAMLKVVLLCC